MTEEVVQKKDYRLSSGTSHSWSSWSTLHKALHLQHAFRTRETSLPVDRLDPQDLEVLVVRLDPERRNVNVRVSVLLRNYCTWFPTCPDFPGGPGVPFVRLGQKKKSHNQKQNYRISQSSLLALRPNVTNCTLNRRCVIPLSNKKKDL